MQPPIAHRDIKIENILFNQNKFKLCDFGSCSSEYADFSKIAPSDFYNYEEFYERNTTMMYRPPEMSDLYLRYEVGPKVDVWMLGCVLYTISYYIHPFLDSSKLAISNANFRFKEDNGKKYSEKLKDLIRHLLTPNPKFRPDIFEVCRILDGWDSLSQISLNV